LIAPACAKARAATVPDGPPLAVPEAPPRVVAPVEPAPPIAAAPAPAENPPAAAAPARPVARPPAARTGSEAESKPTPPVTAVTPPAPEPPRDLRTAPAAGSASERTVRGMLTRANRDLARVDYGKLSTDGRVQYEQAKRFSQQADEALKERNLVFAATLADKAATLAAELLQR
jgi:hypothetical protein